LEENRDVVDKKVQYKQKTSIIQGILNARLTAEEMNNEETSNDWVVHTSLAAIRAISNTISTLLLTILTMKPGVVRNQEMHF
jgi:hypothetical protein